MAKISETFNLKSGAHILVRSFEPGDEQLGQNFSRTLASESKNTLKNLDMPPSSIEKYTEVYSESKSHPVNLYIGAFCDNDLIANLRFFQRNPSHPWVKHVGCFGMGVRKDFWGYGLGSKMLQIMERHARTTEIIRIEAEVRALNDRGVRLYLKNGFKIEGLREKAAFIDNQFVDEYYIAKILI